MADEEKNQPQAPAEIIEHAEKVVRGSAAITGDEPSALYRPLGMNLAGPPSGDGTPAAGASDE